MVLIKSDDFLIEFYQSSFKFGWGNLANRGNYDKINNVTIDSKRELSRRALVICIFLLVLGISILFIDFLPNVSSLLLFILLVIFSRNIFFKVYMLNIEHENYTIDIPIKSKQNLEIVRRKIAKST